MKTRARHGVFLCVFFCICLSFFSVVLLAYFGTCVSDTRCATRGHIERMFTDVYTGARRHGVADVRRL